MKQFSTHDLLWALMSSRKRSCVLMSTQEHSWVWCHGAMSAHECWWALIASWRHAHDCSCALVIAHCSMVPSSWLLMAALGCLWVYMGAHECSWLLIWSTHEKPWAWCYGTMSTHESSRAVMSMAPWSYEHSSALRSAHGTIAQYSWVLNCFIKNNKQKLLSFKMTSM